MFLLFCNVALGDTIMTQVRFRVETEHGQYNDALYYTPAEYDLLTQKDIDDAKQARVDNWIDVVTHPPVYVEPTKEQWIDYRNQLLGDLEPVTDKVIANATKKELQDLQTDYLQKATDLQDEIDIKAVVIE